MGDVHRVTNDDHRQPLLTIWHEAATAIDQANIEETPAPIRTYREVTLAFHRRTMRGEG